MKSLRFAVLFATSLLPASPIDDQQIAESVFVRKSEIYVRYAGSAGERQLTSDGTSKGSPALSKDGKRIAFLRDAVDSALGTIATISADGKPLREIVFRPATANISGMRYIEDLQWISGHEIALSGSINPSTGEYAIVDTETGKEVRGYLVDGFYWAASPDGSHAAYVGYVPHFMPEENRRPQLCLDEECGLDKPLGGYPPPSIHVEFTRKPLWSPDGTVAAITGENFDTNAAVVIVRPLRGKPVLLTPPGTEGSLKLSWDGAALLVRAGTDAWRLEPGWSAFRQVKP